MFQDPQLQFKYEQEGYVIIPLLSKEHIADLSYIATEYAKVAELDLPFYTTIWSENSEYRKMASENLLAYLEPIVTLKLIERRAVMANFCIKNPGFDSECVIHQDWSFVEEPLYDSMTIWIPLIDTNRSNGTLQVVPKSHLLENYIRGGNFNDIYIPFDKQLKEKYLKDIPIQVGDALVMNSRMIHASPPNLSNQTRVALTIAMVPKEAPLIHYIKVDNRSNTIAKRQISPSFYHQFGCMNAPPLEAGDQIISYEPFAFNLTYLDVLQQE